MVLGSDRGMGELQANWKWLVGLGVVLVILGVIALGNLVDATLVTAIIIGYLLIISGVTHLIGAFTGGVSAGWRILQGILGIIYVLVGFNIVFDPLAGALAITVALAILLIVDGLLRIIEAVMDRSSGWGLAVLLGAVNVLLGFWLWTGFPVSGLAIGFFVGLQLVFVGLMWIAAGWVGRSSLGKGDAQSAGV
jgi:uncharacterized membrane protein HdeD (DUF308 family)